MIRRSALALLTFLFLFWLLWPREWLPARVNSLTPLEIGSPNEELIADAPAFSPNGASILLLAPDQEAFAAARVLDAAGVPFTTTRDLASALARRLVVVPAGERAMRLSFDQRELLKTFVANGGTLVVQAAGARPWPELTGLESASPSRRRRRLVFLTAADAGLRALTRPEQREIRLASDATGDGIWTSALTPRAGAADAVARFGAAGEAAVLRRRIGSGRVYTVGFDLRDVFVRPQAARHFDAWSSPADLFQPGADVWPLIFRAWYEDAVPQWACLRALPGDASGLLILSHSLESGDSPAAARQWAAWENSRGVRSTWFVQTNDSDGGQPGPFYDAAFAAALRGVAALGHELAAHTVTHPAAFAALPEGTGLEARRTYRPQTVGGALWDATLMGEIRVPKEILEADVPGTKIAGFRAPSFQYPEILDEDLSASGYSWDSSLSAAQVLTHRPFLLTRRRTMTRESRVVELPMTISDEIPSRRPPLEAADVLRLIRQVSSEEGTVVWQSRANPANRALEAAVLDALPPGTRIETMGEAARWWSAREKTRFRLEPGSSASKRTLRLLLPPEADGARLSFELYAPIRTCSSKTPGLTFSCAGRRVTVLGTGGAREAALALQFEQLDAPEARGIPRP